MNSEERFEASVRNLVLGLMALDSSDPLGIGLDPNFVVGYGNSIIEELESAATLALKEGERDGLILFRNFKRDACSYSGSYDEWRRDFLQVFAVHVRRIVSSYPNTTIQALADEVIAAYREFSP